MQSTYVYKDFTVDVEAEPVDEALGGPVLITPSGYVAVVRIGQGECAEPIASLRFGENTDRPFGTLREALMHGYAAAQRIIDGFGTVNTAVPLDNRD
ncbi:hypothetical protein [Caballeronia novacaledonica]|uniref:Uncharacterized protein n=1 Tax=Caballeronia novacaledonica TaxID=1544861 RepID=A0AA37MIX1_9BURK|nr:hypothetical protein [Caballeronia novacaledonica]GJH28573.1 hypothetical protein CBA19CS42_28675 [Caballeronia novacaledonica]